jgi:sulfonate transport system substrate-binding protein
VKEQKLLEKALPKTEIKWVFSQGSNRSLEYLNSGSVDFATIWSFCRRKTEDS